MYRACRHSAGSRVRRIPGMNPGVIISYAPLTLKVFSGVFNFSVGFINWETMSIFIIEVEYAVRHSRYNNCSTVSEYSPIISQNCTLAKNKKAPVQRLNAIQELP